MDGNRDFDRGQSANEMFPASRNVASRVDPATFSAQNRVNLSGNPADFGANSGFSGASSASFSAPTTFANPAPNPPANLSANAASSAPQSPNFSAENFAQNPQIAQNEINKNPQIFSQNAGDENDENPESDDDFDENDDENPENPDGENARDLETISWTASEAVDHVRGKTWHIAVVATGVGLLALVVLLTFLQIFTLWSAISTGALIVVALVALVVVSRAPVREIEYSITGDGVEIAGKLHDFSEFRAFAVRRLGALWELVLLPVKRFGVESTMFIHEDQGEQIVDELGAVLPMENASMSWVDSVAHRLKL